MAGVNGKYLITGGCGQLGGYLSKFLRAKVGKDNVLVTDVKDGYPTLLKDGPYMKLDVLDHHAFAKTIKDNKITSVIHMAAILSAAGEKLLKETFEINVHFLTSLFLLAKEHGLQVYVPSTIASFGPGTPPEKTPDITIQRPRSIYGVSKVYAELVGEYFHAAHGVDFRCLRYPGMISHKSSPGVSTSYPVDVFHSYFKNKSYECYLEPNTRLPYAYVEDCMANTVKFVLAPNAGLQKRVYNYAAYVLTPEIMFDTLKKSCMPDLKVTYKVDPVRQGRVNAWPRETDTSAGKSDWGLENNFTLEEASKKIFKILKEDPDRDY